MTTVTIRCGMTNSITRSFEDTETIGDMLACTSIRAALSAPENVVAVSGGATLNTAEYVSTYESITLEPQASSKA
jgi:hypothetical protein